MKYETPTEFIDKFMKNEYSKMETVIERLLRENPGLKLKERIEELDPGD